MSTSLVGAFSGAEFAFARAFLRIEIISFIERSLNLNCEEVMKSRLARVASLLFLVFVYQGCVLDSHTGADNPVAAPTQVPAEVSQEHLMETFKIIADRLSRLDRRLSDIERELWDTQQRLNYLENSTGR